MPKQYCNLLTTKMCNILCFNLILNVNVLYIWTEITVNGVTLAVFMLSL